MPLSVYTRDTAGQERYQTITKQYYRRAQVGSLHTNNHCPEMKYITRVKTILQHQVLGPVLTLSHVLTICHDGPSLLS